MSKKRTVNTHFWSDTYVVDLDPIEKLLFLYLLTNEQTNMLGIYEVHVRRISFDTGIDKDMVLKIFERFEESEKAKYFDGYVILRNFIDHQNYNANMETSAIKSWNELPSEIRIDVFCEPILKGLEAFDKGSEPIAEIEIEIEIEKEIEVESETEIETETETKGQGSSVVAIADNVPNASDSETWNAAIRVAEHLLEAICFNDPTHRYNNNPPSLKGWVKQIDLGLRRDGRTEDQFNFMIDAVFYDIDKYSELWYLWPSNIQSGGSLRDQFDKIKNQIIKSKNGNSGKPTKGDEHSQAIQSFYR